MSVSVEEYLGDSGKPYREYVDGILIPKSYPTTLHALVQYELVSMLRRQGVEALAEVTVRLAATKFLIPDVIAAPVLQGPYPTEPVLLCAEILSPGDRLGVLFAKCERYHEWGVPFCWLIEPEKQTAWHYPANRDPQRANSFLLAGELKVSLKELFRGCS